MSQSPSIEEIMQRIRVEVSRRNAASTQKPGSAQVLPPRTPRRAADSERRASAAGFELEINDLSQLRGEIDTAMEGTRRVGQINPRNPGLYNDVIQFMKKVMRRSLAWYTRPLHYFQGGTIRALQRITGVLQSHDHSLQKVSQELARHVALIEQSAEERSKQAGEISQQAGKISQQAEEISKQAEKSSARYDALAALVERSSDELNQRLARTEAVYEEKLNQAVLPYSQRVAAMADEIDSLRSELRAAGVDSLRSELRAARNEMREVKLQGRVRDRDLRRFLHDIQSGTAAPSAKQSAVPVPPMFPSGIRGESEFDYFAFEDMYRGDEADIRRRQMDYLEYFRGRQNVVDIGCGRGEFLELLRDNNISAKGVESGTDQYLLCREKGLDVVQQDLFAFLESLPDESLGGIFSAQVIEHLTASDQLRYVRLAYQKTKPGSPVVFETINAQCVWAVMRNFFLDPTHVRPVHPETLKFAMESVNFKKVELHFSSPMADRLIPPLQLEVDTPQLAKFNHAIQDLNDLLYGNQDYAAIGWR